MKRYLLLLLFFTCLLGLPTKSILAIQPPPCDPIDEKATNTEEIKHQCEYEESPKGGDYMLDSNTLYEYYDGVDDDYYSIYGSTIRGQSFEIQDQHYITSAKLKLYKAGTPDANDIFHYSIYSISGGNPNTELCTSTSALVSNLGTTPGAQTELTFSSCPQQNASTSLAILVHCPNCADGEMYIRVAPGGYKHPGNFCGAENNCSSAQDAPFYEYGLVEETPPAGGGIQMTFPELLITFFAVFILCYIINLGTKWVPKKIREIYAYKIR